MQESKSIPVVPATQPYDSETNLCVKQDPSIIPHEDEGEKSEPDYPSSWKVAIIMVGLCLAVFCLALDNTILATAIPKITDQFNSLDDVGWYGSSYLLATCSLSLVFGKLYTFYSIKWVYLTALAVFEIGSLICGVTPNSLGLIIGRAIAGVGAAGIYSGAMLIITQTMPLDKRPLFTGLVGALYGVAGVTGPLLGGAFTDYVTWRWCFYINLPLGGVTALFILAVFTAHKPIKETMGIRDQLSQLDLAGLSCFLPAVICLLLALQWGGAKYPWDNGRIIGVLVTFGILIVAFIALQWWRQDKATIPPRLIKNRNVWGAAAFGFCNSASLMVFTYYLPIWFQTIQHVSATKSGLLNLPMILGTVTCSVLAGALVNLIGYYTLFMYMSPVIATVGAGLLSTLQVTSGHPQWIGYQALFGIGVGLGLSQPMVAVQAALPDEDLPSATVLIGFMQTLGGSLLISVAQNVFHEQLLQNVARDAPTVDALKVVAAGATKLRAAVPAEALPDVLRAYNSALTHAFYVATAVSGLAILGALPIQWISVKKKKKTEKTEKQEKQEGSGLTAP